MKLVIAIPPSALSLAGPAYISAVLKKAGHEVQGHVFSDRKRLQQELDKGYDFVLTGGLVTQYKAIKEIIDTAQGRQLSTMLGGGLVTSEPVLMMQHLHPTVGVIGQGEQTVVDFFQRWQAGHEWVTTEGVAYTHKGIVHQTKPRAEIKDLDSLPFPDYDCFNIIERYKGLAAPFDEFHSLVDSPREYTIFGSRSCPFRCTFCWHPSAQTYRRRSNENIIAELRWAIPHYNANLVSFYDELFAHRKDKMIEFCTQFAQLQQEWGQPVPWFCNLHVSQVDEEVLDALKVGGCALVGYGLESYSNAVLRSMNKKSTAAQIDFALRETHKRGMAVGGNFIFGDPAETWATAQESLNYRRKVMWAGIRTAWIVPCPDSKDYQYCLNHGLITDKLRHITTQLFEPINMTQMSDRMWGKLLASLSKEEILSSAWATVEQGHRVTCPFCAHRNHYRSLQTGLLSRCSLICRQCRSRFYAAGMIGEFFWKLVATLMPATGWAHWLYRKLRR